MAQVPLWAIGRHVTVCSLTPQTVGADGTLSDGASTSLVGSLDGVEFSSNPEVEEISPITTTRANDVLVKDRTEITLVEILKHTGTNILAAAVTSATYFKVIITRGAQTWTFYGLRGAYSESLQRGKSTASLTLTMVDPNTTNPAYA